MDLDLLASVVSYCGDYTEGSSASEQVEEWIAGNTLLSAQMESLNAAFELVWHLGRFSFADDKLSLSAERTGGRRFRKKVRFSSNIDIIDALAEMNPQGFTSVMLSWLSDGTFPADRSAELCLTKSLTSLTEVSFYKTSSGDNGYVYAPSGVYERLLDGESRIELSAKEALGPARVFKSLAKCGLNSYLKYVGGSVSIADGVDIAALSNYSKRSQTAFELSNVEIRIQDRREEGCAEARGSLPKNLIMFGAPGTGKSYELNKRACEYFPGSDQVCRVTFHPDYSYPQFVGMYKPKVDDRQVYYEFSPGPFIETYTKAVCNPNRFFLLLIEEINRANPAGAFGDVFQLLDRQNGKSKYPIDASEELREYFEGMPGFPKEACDKVSIPENMYIWATMNSADQGVYPMDTAFKRRWDFEYVDIDHGCELIEDAFFSLGSDGHLVNWDKLRRRINHVLLNDCKVNEDKLMGPFFISPDVLKDTDAFTAAFKSKVLLYLCEDAAKMKKSKLFANRDGKTITYSSVCHDFDERGEGIFGFTLDEEV